MLAQGVSNQAKRELSKIEGVHDASQAIILTTMAMKADKFDVDLDKQGQITVVGEQLMRYFRVDHCIYLTRTMFEYLGLLAKSLASQVQSSQKVSEYLLASLSSVIRLI